MGKGVEVIVGAGVLVGVRVGDGVGVDGSVGVRRRLGGPVGVMRGLGARGGWEVGVGTGAVVDVGVTAGVSAASGVGLLVGLRGGAAWSGRATAVARPNSSTTSPDVMSDRLIAFCVITTPSCAVDAPAALSVFRTLPMAVDARTCFVRIPRLCSLRMARRQDKYSILLFNVRQGSVRHLLKFTGVFTLSLPGIFTLTPSLSLPGRGGRQFRLLYSPRAGLQVRSPYIL